MDPRIHALLDREALRDLGHRFADACNRRDAEAFRALWVPDGVWTIGDPKPFRGAGVETIVGTFSALLSLWDFFVQLPHAPVIRLGGDRAECSWTTTEHANNAMRGEGYLNHGLYDDICVRTPDGWRYASRTYSYVYLDENPAAGRPHGFFAPPHP